MEDTPTSYDVLLFGTNLQGAELRAATNQLAKMLKTTPEQATQLLESNGSMVASDVKPELGHKIRERLTAIGIRANLRPHVQSALADVGIEQLEQTLECPACGHQHHCADGEPEPKICQNPACRVVFAKYRKVMEEKAEREKIRKSILRGQQAKLDAERKKLERDESRSRGQRIEEEIRKQLGLPKIINSRQRLFASGIILHLLGVALGIGSVFAFDVYMWIEMGTSTFSKQEVANSKASAVDPGAMALLAVRRILTKPTTGTAQNGLDTRPFDRKVAFDSFGPIGMEDPLVLSATATTSDSTSAATSTSSVDFLNSKLTNFKTDSEWDQYLLTKVDALLAKDRTTSAIKLIGQVRGLEPRFNRGARLMGQLWNRNQAAEATVLYQNLTAAGEQLVGSPVDRIEALSTIARYLNATGRKAETEAILQKVSALTDAITDPADKAVANSETAAILTLLGRAEDARQLFSSAIQALENVADPLQQLATIARLAPGYAKAGYRASALQLLEDAISKGSTLPETTGRSQALGQLAEVSAQLADVQMALSAVRRIATATIRDQTLYRILTQEILSGRLAQATDLAQYLKNPTYKALAFGFLGLSQQGQAAYRGLAATSAQQAHTAVDSIKLTGERAAVMSELGRFAARAGDISSANEYFADSKQLTQSITALPERDRALAVLAANTAQALRFAEAQQNLTQVTDAGVRNLVTTNMNSWQQAANLGL